MNCDTLFIKETENKSEEVVQFEKEVINVLVQASVGGILNKLQEAEGEKRPHATNYKRREIRKDSIVVATCDRKLTAASRDVTLHIPSSQRIIENPSRFLQLSFLPNDCSVAVNYLARCALTKHMEQV